VSDVEYTPSDKGRRSRKARRALAWSHFHFGLKG